MFGRWRESIRCEAKGGTGNSQEDGKRSDRVQVYSSPIFRKSDTVVYDMATITMRVHVCMCSKSSIRCFQSLGP